MNTKICTKCHRELPATSEYFYRDSKCKYGVTTRCKECESNRPDRLILKKQGLKQCSKCKKIYPFTSEYFYKTLHHATGLQVWCKTCNKAISKKQTADLQAIYIKRILSKRGIYNYDEEFLEIAKLQILLHRTSKLEYQNIEFKSVLEFAKWAVNNIPNLGLSIGGIRKRISLGYTLEQAVNPIKNINNRLKYKVFNVQTNETFFCNGRAEVAKITNLSINTVSKCAVGKIITTSITNNNKNRVKFNYRIESYE